MVGGVGIADRRFDTDCVCTVERLWREPSPVASSMARVQPGGHPGDHFLGESEHALRPDSHQSDGFGPQIRLSRKPSRRKHRSIERLMEPAWFLAEHGFVGGQWRHASDYCFREKRPFAVLCSTQTDHARGPAFAEHPVSLELESRCLRFCPANFSCPFASFVVKTIRA